MPEIKRTFSSSKMNKDVDERLVPAGEYRDAQNIEINTSDGSNVGTVQTLKGNTIGVASSPFTLAFSSGEKTKKQGAGPAGIGFTTTEFGYLVLGRGVNWGTNSGYNYYPSVFPNYSTNLNYDTKKYFLGFVHPVEFENAPELDTLVSTQGGGSVDVKGFDEQDQQTQEVSGHDQ